MPLPPGEQIGHFEILELVGAGGMGEVYRARDKRLKRDVALKVLLPAFARDPERYARFQREAEVLASLNHPNVATLYGMVENALIMEFVEGPTLGSPLPLDTALKYARQIAEALEYAHERGVIHRDLKPANIKVTPDGVVKVLDFGLAKALDNTPSADSTSAANSPTLTLGHTVVGQILGTAAYMSPEQVEGHRADRRADVWSFGAVLFEMLAGKRAFEGTTNVVTLASVVKSDPDWSALPANTPANILALLKRCLTKDRKQRLQAIGEARIAIETPTPPPAPPAPPAPNRDREGAGWSRLRGIGWIAAAVLALASAALGYVAYRHTTEEAPRVIKMSVLPPEKGELVAVALGPPALSPDGRHVAFPASVDGKRALWVRDLDSATPRMLPGTEDANNPFWSPDSRFVAFGVGSKLKKMDVAGGPALTVCDAPALRGGSWSRDDIILFAPNSAGGLFRVPAAGGIATQVTELDKTKNENLHRTPWFLPDGRHFLFLARSNEAEKSLAYIGDLESKERKQVIAATSVAIYTAYAGQGYLLFMRDRTLMAQRFDAGKLATSGDAVPVAEQVDFNAANYFGGFTASQNGVLAYTAGGAGSTVEIIWEDRGGKVLGTVGTPYDIQWVALSPDGSTVATDRRDPQSGNRDLWLNDLARGTASRLTFVGNSQFPVWLPDGAQVAFRGERKGKSEVYRKAANGTGQEEALGTPDARPVDWSRDGRYLFFENPGGGKTANDIWVMPQFGDKKYFAYVQSEFVESMAKLSPEGRWLAYHSNESKRNEVYVVSFPQPGGKWQISTNGGRIPVWSRDGRELFFVSADNKMMAVEIKTPAGKFEAGVPKALFGVRLGPTNPNFDVSKDGRFLIPTQIEQGASAPLTVVLNWPAMLK